MKVKDPALIGKNELLGAEYKGQDQNRQPFEIAATRATQNSDHPDLVDMEGLRGLIAMQKEQSDIALHADMGQYQQSSNEVVLTDNVRLIYGHNDPNKSFTITARSVNIDLNKNIAITDTPIEGNGALGTLKAQSMRADHGTGKIIFGGKITLILNHTILKDTDSKKAKTDAAS
jgi:LPS export ABC transporter protein LptC